MRQTMIAKWLMAALLASAGTGLLAQSRPVEGVVLSNDGWPRATRLSEWTADVIRISGNEKGSETAQGKAFFEWLRLFSRMAVGGMIQSFEGPYGQERPVLDAHKQLFVYGWGFCDTSSRIAEAAWKEYKRDVKAASRVITQHEDGGYHTMYSLRMDGRDGAFDPRYGYYLIERDAPDARVLGWAELKGKFELNRGFKHRSRPFFEIAGKEWDRALLLEAAYFESEAAWRAAGAPIENVFGDTAYTMGTRFHEMGFTMLRGMTIERRWDNGARKFYIPAGERTKREWPFLPSGRFYRVTEESHGGNWPEHDPNYGRIKQYLSQVPAAEGYPEEVAGGRTIGQASGVIEYRPKLSDPAFLDGLAPGGTLRHSVEAPHLRPARPGEGGEAVFDIRSPFVLVDGTLSAALAGAGTEVAIRTFAPKPRNAAEPDEWSEWETLITGPGSQRVELGRPRFNGNQVSIHGVYRFQLRIRVSAGGAPAGLREMGIQLHFENGIMSIPPLFAGSNTLRFRVAEAGALKGPVTVEYRYETAAGEKVHRQVLSPADFREGEAVYRAEAPGLTRCRTVSVSY
jgi:hypothetical protein